MTTYVQDLLSGNDKTAGTSIQITGSKTITVGNVIFLAFASDDVGSSYSVVDNLGNTYASVKEQINTGNVKTQLWRAPITVGGTLTSQTVSWTTNATATAACSGEFGSVGTLKSTHGANSAVDLYTIIPTTDFFTGELWVCAAGSEDDVIVSCAGSTGTPTQTAVNSTGANTTGGGSASNISIRLGYILINANSSVGAVLGANTGVGAQDQAGAGAIYNAAPVLFANPTNFQNPGIF